MLQAHFQLLPAASVPFAATPMNDFAGFWLASSWRGAGSNCSRIAAVRRPINPTSVLWNYTEALFDAGIRAIVGGPRRDERFVPIAEVHNPWSAIPGRPPTRSPSMLPWPLASHLAAATRRWRIGRRVG